MTNGTTVVNVSTIGHQHPTLNGNIAELKREALQTLTENILPFWLKMQDLEHGGFYGQMTGDGTLVKNANKGCILNARILWSFSAAYRVTGKQEYLEAATRAKDYILQHFIDKEYGGCYWELDCYGNPVNTKKQFYAIGFVIYGLSEYYRATAERSVLTDNVAEQGLEVLQTTFALFDCIEEHSLDHEYNGYTEAMTRDWQPIADMRLSDLDANYPKSQNTHLHIIEPYTNLLRALKEQAIHSGKQRHDNSANHHPVLHPSATEYPSAYSDYFAKIEYAIRNLINIFTDHILNPETHHLDLFFENDWTRGAGHLESYGHDIECSWLLHEAAIILGDKEVLKKVEPIVQLVAKASEKGLNHDGSMIHEANLDTSYADTNRHWWVQAETVVGFFNIYQYFHDNSALEKALHCWQYIKENLIDSEGGEWFWSRDSKGIINTGEDKAGFWKCPYHNSRMCLEIIERAL